MSDNVPRDMLAILLRIDAASARSETKIDSLSQQVAALTNKQDDHETRIRSIEGTLTARQVELTKWAVVQRDVDELMDWRTEIKTASRSAQIGAKLLWVMLAAFAFIAAYAGQAFITESVKSHIESATKPR